MTRMLSRFIVVVSVVGIGTAVAAGTWWVIGSTEIALEKFRVQTYQEGFRDGFMDAANRMAGACKTILRKQKADCGKRFGV